MGTRTTLMGRAFVPVWLLSRALLAAPGAPPVPDIQAPPTRDEDDEPLPPPPPASPSSSSAPAPSPAPAPADSAAPEPAATAPSRAAAAATPSSAAIESEASSSLPATNLESSPPTTSMDQPATPSEAPEQELFATRPWSFDVTLGGGTPIGTFGVSLDYHLTPSISFGGGAGVGSGPHSGSGLDIHGGIFVRARPVRNRKHAFVLEGALSGGPYQRHLVFGGTDVPNAEVSTSSAFFLQGAAGWEKRSEKGLLVRLTAGAAFLLNPGDLKCVPENTYSYSFGSQPALATCQAFPHGAKIEAVPTIAFTLGKTF